MRFITNNRSTSYDVLSTQTLCLVPDYSTKLDITSGSVLQYDVYVNWIWVSLNDNAGHFYIDDVSVDCGSNSTFNLTKCRYYTFSGFIKKGAKVSWSGSGVAFFRVM